MMDEEWGPWIEHDGKGCPCRGMWVECQFDDLRPNIEGVARGDDVDGTCGWYWRNKNRVAVFVRYRVRKPRGLKILEQLLADLPATDKPVRVK